jgi:hypothetical protein
VDIDAGWFWVLALVDELNFMVHTGFCTVSLFSVWKARWRAFDHITAYRTETRLLIVLRQMDARMWKKTRGSNMVFSAFHRFTVSAIFPLPMITWNVSMLEYSSYDLAHDFVDLLAVPGDKLCRRH